MGYIVKGGGNANVGDCGRWGEESAGVIGFEVLEKFEWGMRGSNVIFY